MRGFYSAGEREVEFLLSTFSHEISPWIINLLLVKKASTQNREWAWKKPKVAWSADLNFRDNFSMKANFRRKRFWLEKNIEEFSWEWKPTTT